MSVLVKTGFKKFVLDVLMCTHLCLFRIKNTSVFFYQEWYALTGYATDYLFRER